MESEEQRIDGITMLRDNLKVLEEGVSKSLLQLALLHLGLQRCRRLKSALVSQELQLRQQLETLNSDTPDHGTVYAQQEVMISLLGNRPRPPQQETGHIRPPINNAHDLSNQGDPPPNFGRVENDQHAASSLANDSPTPQAAGPAHPEPDKHCTSSKAPPTASSSNTTRACPAPPDPHGSSAASPPGPIRARRTPRPAAAAADGADGDAAADAGGPEPYLIRGVMEWISEGDPPPDPPPGPRLNPRPHPA